MKTIRSLQLFLLILFFYFSGLSFVRAADPLYPFHPTTQINFTSSNLPIVIIDLKERMADKDEDRRVEAEMKILYRPDGSRNYMADTILLNNTNADIVNYSGCIGIKYRGNSSYNSDKKPFGLKTQNSAGKNQVVDILGMGVESDWALLAPFFDKSLVRETLIFELMRGYLEFSPGVRYCEVVLNGIYQGIYIMTARPRKGEDRLDLPKPKTTGNDLTGGYQLEFDRTDGESYFTSKQYRRDIYGNQQNGRHTIIHKYPDKEDYDSGEMNVQKQYIENHIHAIEAVLAGSNYKDPENGYRKYWDVTSVIDFMLAQEMTRSVDAYRLSAPFYKRRDSVDPRIKMTIWDFDRGWGNSRASDAWSNEGWAWNQTITSHPFWFKRFLSDESFREEIWERWAYYRKTKITDENVMNTVDSLMNVLGEAKDRNFTIWNRWGQEAGPCYYVSRSWQDETDYLKQWILGRFKWLDSQFQPYPDNYVANASFDADSKRGAINSILLSSWTVSSSSNVSLSTISPYEGSYCLQLQNQAEAYQTVTELPDDTYTLKAWVRTTWTPEASIIIRNHGTATINVPITSNSNYTEITVPDIRITKGLCDIVFKINSATGSNARLAVDNVSLFRNSKPESNGLNNNFIEPEVKIYPNPFTERITFEYLLLKESSVITISSIVGVIVDKITVNGQAGNRTSVNWNAPAELNPGVYFYTIQNGTSKQSGKIIK